MKNKLSAYISVFTIIVLSCITFVLPDNTTTHLIVLATLSFILGLYTSVGASKKKCKRISKLRSLYHGFLAALVSTGIFAFLSYIPVANKPFELVVKNEKIAKYIGSLIYIYIGLTFIIKKIYKDSIKYVFARCSVTVSDNLKKYNEYLDKKPDSTDLNIETR